jgi:hypothetical protein
MKAVISQPRYLPALNYLQRLKFADVFVLLDLVQRQSRGWENRNKLLLPSPSWLTIPIASSSREIIKKSKVDGFSWIAEHKNKINHFYSSADFYDRNALDASYDIPLDSPWFSDVAYGLIIKACAMLDFRPNVILSSDLFNDRERIPEGADLLAEICRRLAADVYVSGPNGAKYGIEKAFEQINTIVEYHDFTHPVYPQGQVGFYPYMGWLDSLFNAGIDFVCEVVKKEPRWKVNI